MDSTSKTNSYVQPALAGVAGLGDVFGCCGTEEVDETLARLPGGPVSDGLSPKLQAPSSEVEIQGRNKGRPKNYITLIFGTTRFEDYYYSDHCPRVIVTSFF